MATTGIDRSGAFGAEIVVQGLDSVLNGFDEVDPKLKRRLNRDLKSPVDTVAQTASRQVETRSPSSGTAEGYKVQRRGSSFKIVNRTRGAMILEFAAVPHCPQGVSLVNTLNEKYGAPGRILWDAWDTMEGWVTDRVASIVRDAESELDRLLDE
jgi:hypothetical protein